MNDRQYIDVKPFELSPKANELLEAQRQTYLADKAARAALVTQLRAEITCSHGDVVLGVHYTRWGQLQVSIGQEAAPKAKAKARPSLSDYLAQQHANGR